MSAVIILYIGIGGQNKVQGTFIKPEQTADVMFGYFTSHVYFVSYFINNNITNFLFFATPLSRPRFAFTTEIQFFRAERLISSYIYIYHFVTESIQQSEM